ncbi:NAD(P)/FAD-dependent oxidoreductase [Rathayibacter rathayi]|uniref:dihydrolipoyl dehydrogenase family protein n=1 Tax=Rathayibacter rathayi TaxID=33887 RepID=UPI000BD6BAFB|nr:NAD(P)/FAD-dependent oxidoreductase [Rathayibacter rathayi]AZZ48356.1 NAD(P)/FAD-dependent oxidoreductase [Rathayibacter rathayi]MWV74257.1 pyridine nucleotide-disulfide oxidoreductase [Rathayibacter rathayi NCPPB 2980 = VKM Ac-1601]PPF49333.1 NAD(P)/FAD-dependent oxidoreductase [Rathayibacter rathayi]PPG69770.1 NAD(P)/FAD-dependent oxidoreductase [Rathayibacter rathayi]PPG78192.1 NAD(P)/FAD-dependent oxidoreductase [Rathayibacter rathayi]
MSSTTTDEFDVIVIGAGPVGENLADRAVQGGLTAAVVESELVGGECSYWACMPSKALLRPPMALRAAHDLLGAAQAVSGGVDVAALLARRDSFTSHFDDHGQVQWLEGAGIELVRGHGRLSAEREVTVTGPDGGVRVLRARSAVAVATGTRAVVPDIPGLRAASPWTSREATSAEEVPPRLVVIGGGVVATEMATAYAGMGSSVTLVARSGLLAPFEPFAGELVGDALRALGVDLRLGHSPASVERRTDGIVTVTLTGGDVIEAEQVLAATGRAPHTRDIGLETVELEPGSSLAVDDTMLVLGADGVPLGGDRPWLYGVGDVNHRALLTHQGKYQARAAGDVIVARAAGTEVQDAPWGAHVATADHEAVPQVVFTDPEVASVGLTAAAAEKAGYRIRVIDYEIGSVAGAALAADGYTGTARMVVDEDRKVVLGVTFVGKEVGELIHSATIAVVGEVPLSRLWHAIPSYPTISEVWLRLLETYGRDSA